MDKKGNTTPETAMMGENYNHLLAIYNTYIDRLYSLALIQLNGNTKAAELIVSKTFMTALKLLERVPSEKNVRLSIFKIFHKKLVKYSELTLQSQDSTTDVRHVRNRTPFKKMLINDDKRQQHILQAVLNLPLDYREVVILKCGEDMSTSEISDITGRSPRSIKEMLEKCNNQIRHYLEIESVAV